MLVFRSGFSTCSPLHRAGRAIRVIAFALAAGAWLTTASFASDVDALVDLLVKKGVVTESEADGLRAEMEAQKKAEAEKKKAALVTAKRPVQLSGYVQIRGTSAEGENDSFLIRRARVSLLEDIAPRWDYKFQADFGNTARTGVESVDFEKRKTKTTSLQRPLLLDAQVNYSPGAGRKLSFGQFKIPFSYENLVSSTELDTINRAQVIEKLVPGRDIGSQGRDIGATFGSTGKRLDYFVGLVNGTGINAADDNHYKDQAARVVLRPSQPVSLGLSWYNGRSGGAEAVRDRIGAEASYRDGRWALRGEYVSGKDDTIRKTGWYAHAGYRFRPGWEGVLRFDGFDPNRSVADNQSDVLTLGLNRFVTDAVKVQLNYERRNDESADTANNALLGQLQVKF